MGDKRNLNGHDFFGKLGKMMGGPSVTSQSRVSDPRPNSSQGIGKEGSKRVYTASDQQDYKRSKIFRSDEDGDEESRVTARGVEQPQPKPFNFRRPGEAASKPTRNFPIFPQNISTTTRVTSAHVPQQRPVPDRAQSSLGRANQGYAAAGLENSVNLATQRQQQQRKGMSVDAAIRKASGLSMVGGVLVDNSKFSSSMDALVKKPSEKVSASKVLASNTKALDAEIDAILGQKSSHQHNVEAEAHEAFMEKSRRVAWKEKKMEEENKVTQIKIRAHHCMVCKSITEGMQPFCQKARHTVNIITTLKRWFECRKCHTRCITIGNKPFPTGSCGKCGACSWVATGKWGTGQKFNGGVKSIITAGGQESHLILSAAEDSSYRDRAMTSAGAIHR